ncbi:MAG: SCP2 sterol-binding domain-containing protein [Proteobacteria bacterium]|nr:SCP2 sterol-binding domain-containing protein [Pseudomonadota bacterium]MDA1063178.1 SCP2 sterol-binding domain-containing protein [Pseudomonadota bacterium]
MASPLEVLLRPVAEIMNRNIAETMPARALARDLNGATVAIRARDTALSTFFTFADDRVTLSTEYGDEPDVVISASLITLTRMLGGSGEAAIRDGDVELTGDAAIAQRFQKLLGYAKPDVEEEMSRVVGDMAAHRLAEIARGIGIWARAARSTIGDNVREYLQEESRDLPTRYEVDRFGTRLGVLRDDVERLAARLQRLEGNR